MAKWKNTHSISKSKKKSKSGKWKTKFYGNIIKEKGKPYAMLILDDVPQPDKDGKVRLQVWDSK